MPGEYILNAIEPAVQGQCPYVVENLFMTGQRPDTGYSAGSGWRLGRTICALWRKIRRHLLRTVRDEATAKDLMQEVLLRLCRETVREEKREVLHMVYDVEMEVMSRDRRKKPSEPSSNV